MNRKIASMIILGELVFLLVTALISSNQTGTEWKLSGEMLSEEAVNTIITSVDGGVRLDNPSLVTYTTAESMVYDPIILSKGSYDITIQYRTYADNNYYVISSSKDSYIDALYAEDLTGFLSSASNLHTSHIRITEDEKKMQLQVYYWGNGQLDLEKVTVCQTNTDSKYHLLLLALLFGILDICLVKKEWIICQFSEKNYQFTMTLILLVFVSSLPIFVHGIYIGQDTTFHITRMEGLKEAIISHQFPAKMHSTHLFGYGYATGQMYPQLFLYPESILRVFGIGRVDAHRFLIFMVNVLTVSISYYSFIRIFKDRSIALCGGVLYTLAPYRIVDLYIGDSVGEYCAMIGLPLVIWGLYSFVADEHQNEEPSYIELAIGYTIVMESHLLTSLFIVLFSIILGLIFIRRMYTRNKIMMLCKTIILTILLNIGFLTPFLDYMRLPMNQFVDGIESQGIDVVQVFTNGMLQNSDKLISIETIDGISQVRIDNEMPYGIGYALIISSVLFILFVRREREKRALGLVALLIGVLNVVFSLHSFPWNDITNISIFAFLTNVQFPWRFLMFATIAFTISGCIGIKYLMHRMSRLTVAIIVSLIALYGYINITDYLFEVVPVEDDVLCTTMDLGMINEYLFRDTNPLEYVERGGLVAGSSDKVILSEYEKHGTNITLYAINNSNSEQAVELPLTMYPGYAAKDSNGNKLNVTYGNNQVICVMLPEHFNDRIKVYFAGKWYWKVSTFISLLTAIYLIIYFVLNDRAMNIQRDIISTKS